MIIGSPAKSVGSRIEAMTTSHGQPLDATIVLIDAVLPTPGPPHTITGTSAAIASARASSTIAIGPPSAIVPSRMTNDGTPSCVGGIGDKLE